MKKLILILITLCIYQIGRANSPVEYANNQLIVQLKSGSILKGSDIIEHQKFKHDPLDALNARNQLTRIELTGNPKQNNTFVLVFTHQKNIPQLVLTYQNTGLFAYVEPNYIGYGGGVKGTQRTAPDDTYFSRQYGLHNDGTFTNSPATVDADVDMDLAWDITTGSESVIVAVLDAGLRLNHPEFAGRLWVNPNETTDGLDTDSNHYIDDINGWDFANNDKDPTDDHGHGTNVTGIIAANGNNLTGYAGVDWKCKIMTCKILNSSNNGQYSWWADAIYYAVDNGARILNMSVGGGGKSSLLENAVKYANEKGVTIVACMMNYNNKVPQYPAGFSETIAVGSTDANDQRSAPFFWSSGSGSCFGTHIDVVAPGNYIYGLKYNSNTNYETYWGGTSQATPLVAGVCALLLAQDPNRSPEQIRKLIRNSAEDQVGKATEDVEGFDIYHGYGRVNAYQALLQGQLSTSQTKPAEFMIYPNPVSKSIEVKSSVPFKSVQISTSLGQKILVQINPSDTKSLRVDLSTLSKGVYLLSIINAHGEFISTQKIELIEKH